MKRREFNLQLGTVGLTAMLGASLSPLAQAQGAPREGQEFTRLKEPVAVSGGGRIEVIEFFGYWCPHCAAFEPVLDAWARKLPADVHFRRMPVAFQAAHEHYQKLYFGIEALGAVPALHGKVFTAMHGSRQRLDKDAEIVALAAAHGVDGAKLLDAMKSFIVATKVNQARQLAQAYHLDGVPTLAVNGRFTTSVTQAGTHERALQVVENLIQGARKG